MASLAPENDIKVRRIHGTLPGKDGGFLSHEEIGEQDARRGP